MRLKRAEEFGPGDLAAVTLGAFLWTGLFPLSTAYCLAGIELDDSEALSLLGWDYRGRDDVIVKNILLIALGVLLNFVLAFGCWRWARRRETLARQLSAFLICWWRSCLAGTLFLPAIFVLSWLIFNDPRYGLLVWPPFLVLAPSLIAPRVFPTRQRWRPVCPECGHTVAYAVEPRCTECGAAYPSERPHYRRWAIRRLPWEQRGRSLATAYLATIVIVLLRPWQAAWRLAIPDQLGRAFRWSAGHLLLGPLGLAAVSPLCWVVVTTLLAPRRPDPWEAEGIYLADVYHWNLAAQLMPRVIAWIVLFCYPVLLGVLLSLANPWSQPATRRAMVKWSLYAGAVLPAVALPLFVSALLATLLAPWGLVAGWLSYPGGFIGPAALVVTKLLILIYAVYWAIGAAAQPWEKRRGALAFATSLIVFIVAWILSLQLFDLRGFGVLL